jgi:hypothetical protein
MKKLYYSIWKLKKLPLTEQFGKFSRRFRGKDQEVIMLKKNGIVMLKKKIPAKFLYGRYNYNYTTLEGSKKKDLDIFYNFVKRNVNLKKIKKIVDIGRNDLTLSKKFKNKFNTITAIDPLVSKELNQNKGFLTIKKYIEQINFHTVFKNTNLIIARHTLEHLSKPKYVLKKIFKNIDENCKIIIEVPDLDQIIKKKRFDTIIHQHYYYFDQFTLTNIINESGGDVLSFKKYTAGPCGGSLIFCCKRSDIIKKTHANKRINTTFKFKRIKKSIKYFKKELLKLKRNINLAGYPIYGYGAGLMLPTFIYHLGIDTSLLKYIFDDDKNKNNFSYKNLNVKVVSTDKSYPPLRSNYLITSLENKNIIKKKVLKFKPNNIFTF